MTRPPIPEVSSCRNRIVANPDRIDRRDDGLGQLDRGDEDLDRVDAGPVDPVDLGHGPRAYRDGRPGRLA